VGGETWDDRAQSVLLVRQALSGSRVERIWTDADVARFLGVAPPLLRLPMLLAINTGQRQGDLRRLPWSAYDGTVIRIRQRKTGAYVPVRVSDELKAALDAAPRVSPVMLVNSDGKPWSESGFQSAWGRATTRAGIEGLTFHDLRGTAVVMLARAGCTEAEIYSITGHKPSRAGDPHRPSFAARLRGRRQRHRQLNAYQRARGDQKGDENLPTAFPTALKIVGSKPEKAK
jgi:integrase